MSETETKVCKLIADELGYDLDEVTPDSTFEMLEADSLDRTEIVILIEEEFNLTIPDDDAQGFNTVGDMVRYVDNQTGS